MKDRILETLERIEWEWDVDVLYACESGSRAWGFASPDSDYDVRFVYAGRLDRYLTVDRVRDVIELPIVDDLDINGWDVKKALALLRNSNPTLLEWLHSPVVYRACDGFIDALRELATQAVNPRALVHHYLSMARSNWRRDQGGSRISAKRYLYVLRPLLAVQWVIEHGSVPPVAFDALMAGVVREEGVWDGLNALLVTKSASGEQSQMLRHPELDRYINQNLWALAERVPEAVEKPPVAPFNDLLRVSVGG
ncbi:MAG: nucleotidyltransferase domain-containing protein [Pseudomonadales bacterium]|nr:nucleotidyltransferase domain-containing protein [Pseudomonadales bacterium]